MPPYKFNTSRSWGRHYGADFGGVPATFATWDPLTHNANIVLSNGDLTATRLNTTSGELSSVLATIGKSSGKWYWETLIVSPNAPIQHMLGISRAGLLPNTYPGSNATSYGYNSQNVPIGADGTFWHTAAATTGHLKWNHLIPVWLMTALDMDGGRFWWGVNGSWDILAGGLLSNPATGLNPSFSGLAGTYFPAMGLYYHNVTNPVGGVITANFGASAFQFSPPAGFNSGIFA